MKKILSLFFLSFVGFLNAQTKINFNYDGAGNQTKRYITIDARPGNPTDSIFNTVEMLSMKDMHPTEYDKLSYYPNPVKEELYLKWATETTSILNSIELYNMSGQRLATLNNLELLNTATVNFQSYPSGWYNVVLIYNTGDSKTLKIVKR